MTASLLVDVGNSRVKWATLEGRRIGGVSAVAHSADSLTDLLRGQWSALPAPARVLVSSVIGEGPNAQLRKLCASLWGLECDFAHARSSALGLTNGYRDPGALGVDRWLAMLAAWHSRRAAFCVADCGSAVTIDAIDADGRHLGGLIIPGVQLMQRALRRGTSIPEFAPTGTGTFFGRDTAEAVTSGVVQAIAGAIERALVVTSGAAGQTPPLIVTGGDGPVIANALAVPCELRPSLVLEGLAVLAQNPGR